ncbi:MAG: hypothetical protein EWV50_02875 [Microcystis aeruginosa Ma_MB_F_20061100_S20]|uniref:Uncharacterized protein n=1 Tax=Microcystis aeruginosa Ma_MB_F_20061100_S20D TaxID=2486253 RepID=A0A552EBB5_MICAE|nr:MAG: hypothetical protein EWV78_19835 [Microcystis aeruginosa Ma_MB_F_20061100_S20D]TRU42576.1 MAG: hypothetical protein EWV50_02875 [Microcystis aeruginosa Ma_MB_F_20061100_S20]
MGCVTFSFITQSKLLGGSTPQTPRWGRGAVTERVEVPPPNPPRISFSVGCLHAIVHIFVPISESLIIADCRYFCKCGMQP